MKKILGAFLAACVVLSLSAPCFALLNTVKNEGTSDIVKIGDDVDVPVGAHIDSAVAIKGSITIGGSVAKDVVAIGGSVTLDDNAMVNGDVVAIGGKVIKAQGAMVNGSISEISLPRGIDQLSVLTTTSVIKGLAFFELMMFVGFLALTMIMVALFTPQLGLVSVTAEKKWLYSLLMGLLVIGLFVPIIIILIISIIGIVLIPVWIILVVTACLFGYVGAAHMVGKKILYAFKARGKSMMLETICGVIVIYLICLIPIIGWLIKIIISLIGLGSVVLTRFGTKNN